MVDQIPKYGNRLDVVLKIAERCNLACPYCYYFFQEHNPKARRALIDEQTIIDVKNFLKKGIHDYEIEHIVIGLHGGEPLLMPKKRFDTYVSILRELDDETSVNISMQTNGTLVDAEWIELFEKHQVSVGVSIDGTPEAHDKGRPDHQGRGSYEKALHGLRMLQEAHRAERIKATGILCVANPDYHGGEIVRHVVEELGVHWFNLLFPRDGYDAGIQHEQEKWIRYYGEVLAAWEDILRKHKAEKKGMVVINEVTGVLNAMIDERAALHHDWMSSNRHFIMTISSEGDIGPDDNVMALDDRLCDSGMNVRDHSMTDFFCSPFWAEFNEAVDFVPEKCGSCEWYRTCRSGHLFNRYSKENGFKNPTVFCETSQYLHKRLLNASVQRGIEIEKIANILSEKPHYQARDFMHTEVVV